MLLADYVKRETIRIVIFATSLLVDDGIRIIYKVARVFTVTSVQRATEAVVHGGFM